MDRVQRSLGRRALFVATDIRSLMTLIMGLSAFFVVSLAAGYGAEVVYPWNAPRPEPARALADDPEPEGLLEESTAEVVRPLDEAVGAAESPSTVARPAVETAPATTSPAPELTVPPRAPGDIRAAPQASSGRPTVEDAPSPGAVEAEVRSEGPPPVDLTPVTSRIEEVEAAIEAAQLGPAMLALAQVDQAALRVESTELAQGQPLRLRIEAARDDVAMLQFEQDLLDAIQVARSAQETGNYPAAIGALNTLVERVSSVPVRLSSRMQDRVDFYQIAATANNLLEACQFERTNLGRTAPCTR